MSSQNLSSTQANSHAIAFIDAAVADHEALALGLAPDVEYFVLDPTLDGITQISDVLQSRSNVDSVQIISHGSPGSLQLGATQLDLSNLSNYQSQFQSWKAALSETADILLYGCNVAAGSIPNSNSGSGYSPFSGIDFVKHLSQLTGADVAASNNPTGKGGDWDLEVQTGAIEASPALQAAAMESYQGTLGTITVTSAADSGSGTLRDAIAKAPAGTTIRFSSTLAGKTITLTTGQLLITKNLIIDGTGATGLTISGNRTSRVLNIEKYIQVTLSNLTIAYGKTTGVGGGVNVKDYGKITVNNCKFNYNVGGIGGGLRIGYGGSGVVVNSSFTSNDGRSGKSGFSGGAIATYGSGSLTVKGSKFTSNLGINGGAIYNLLGPLTVENCVFSKNSAAGDIGGGAVFTDGANPVGPSATVGGQVIIRGSRFEANQAQGEGGAMVLYGYGPDKILVENSTIIGNTTTANSKGVSRGGGLRANSALTIRNVTFANNSAGKQGGGVWLDGTGPINIINSTFSGNKAVNDAGGAMLLGTPSTTAVNITNCTIANNYAGRAAGAVWIGGSSNPVTLTNSIVVNNTATDPSQQQVGYQLRDGGGNIEFPKPISGRRVVAGSRMVDPLLGSLQTLGGSLVRPLLTGSPAINTGVIKTGVPTIDQRGYLRDSKVDVGTFEVGATASTTSTTLAISSTSSTLTSLGSQRTLSEATLTTADNSDPLTGSQTTDPLVGVDEPQAFTSSEKGSSLGMAEHSHLWQRGFLSLTSDRQLMNTTPFPIESLDTSGSLSVQKLSSILNSEVNTTMPLANFQLPVSIL